MNNGNQPFLNQNQEPPKNFWQRLKLWQKIGIIVLAVTDVVLLYYILLISPNLFDLRITETPDTVFNTYLTAEEKCDINLANSVITEKSKEIMHYTCSNMADERKCHINKTFKVLTKGDTAIIHFDDFSHKTGWPFFFAKENGEWKIDFYKMAFGIAMGGSGCDTGWGWRNEEIKNEFCSYFKEGECPEENITQVNRTTKTGYLQKQSAKNPVEFCENEKCWPVEPDKTSGISLEYLEQLAQKKMEVNVVGRTEIIHMKGYSSCSVTDIECQTAEYDVEYFILEKLTYSDFSSKSCEELGELRRKELNKIDLSCKNDADCVVSDVLPCGGCVNKNANEETYKAIIDMEYTKNCPLPVDSCPFFTGCKCASNKCESI